MAGGGKPPPVHDAVRQLPITPGTPALLVIAFQAFGQAQMDDKPDVGLVDPCGQRTPLPFLATLAPHCRLPRKHSKQSRWCLIMDVAPLGGFGANVVKTSGRSLPSAGQWVSAASSGLLGGGKGDSKERLGGTPMPKAMVAQITCSSSFVQRYCTSSRSVRPAW